MMNFIRRHPIAVSASAVGAIALIAWLAFGYFAIQTHFIDDEVSEAAPVFDAASPAPPATSLPPASEPGVDDIAAVTQEASAIEAPVAPAATAPGSRSTVPPAPTTNEIVAEYTGQFESDAHPTMGTASVLGNGSDQRFLRFEGFETDNGPDLDVYLVNSSAGGVSDFVSLGDLKGNVGDQNYEIAADVDLSVYDRVVIWCVRFGVGFGQADLTASA